jgi:hypothetical protein
MKPYTGLVTGAAVSFLALSPARSADLQQLVDLDIQPSGTGLELQLAIAGESREIGEIGEIIDLHQIATPLENLSSVLSELESGDRHLIAQEITVPPTSENTQTTEEEVNTDPEILFPDPQIPREGKPSPASSDTFLRPSSPLPPFLPRASAPPVGDITVSTIDTTFPNYVDLGTAAVVPRLVLREAPVQDVLTLLSRSADLNLVFANAPSTSADGEENIDSLANKTISLDLENEPVQDVFNYVLMLSDLKATMRGRTFLWEQHCLMQLHPELLVLLD